MFLIRLGDTFRRLHDGSIIAAVTPRFCCCYPRNSQRNLRQKYVLDSPDRGHGSGQWLWGQNRFDSVLFLAWLDKHCNSTHLIPSITVTLEKHKMNSQNYSQNYYTGLSQKLCLLTGITKAWLELDSAVEDIDDSNIFIFPSTVSIPIWHTFCREIAFGVSESPKRHRLTRISPLNRYLSILTLADFCAVSGA